MYIVLALVMLLRGFADALMMRAQQAIVVRRRAWAILPPHHYDQIFTAHGVIMIFFVAMPLVTGLMNFVVPLQIGARDVAFPFLNNFSFWMTVGGAVLVMIVAVRRRVRAHRLAGLPAAVRARVQPGRRRRLLHLVAADRRRRHPAVGRQPDRHHRQDARAGHDHDEDADVHLDRAVHQRADRRRLPDADRGAGAAVAGPLRRHATSSPTTSAATR